jgi:hypothetical protein
MTNTHETVIVSARHIGVIRLGVLIKACELEAKGLKRRGASALSILKRELGVRGNRDKVLAVAKESLANVASW